jgi:hypothetical protein
MNYISNIKSKNNVNTKIIDSNDMYITLDESQRKQFPPSVNE